MEAKLQLQKPGKIIVDTPESSPTSSDTESRSSSKDERGNFLPEMPITPLGQPPDESEDLLPEMPITPLGEPPDESEDLLPEMPITPLGEPPQSPPYAQGSPAYAPTSPASDDSIPYNPQGSPVYRPTSPAYRPSSPASDDSIPYNPQGSPAYRPISPASDDSIPYNPIVPTLPKPVKKTGFDKKIYGKKILDIYTKTLVAKKVSIEMKYIGSNIKETLEKKLKESHEGKCIAEGYVKKNTIKIISYSSGKICSTGILYEISFECFVCFPVEGQILKCVATNITKAGIKAINLENPSPFVVFISRDHQLSNKKFNSINEKDHFDARIIGQRFELNDPYISIIAEIK